MKKVIISIILTLLIAVVTINPASAKTNSCEVGGENHVVAGKGTTLSGNFNIIGRQTKTQDAGMIYYDTILHKIKGKINCTSFNVNRVDFFGEASYWTGNAWEQGYSMTGYAQDDINGDQLFFYTCKDNRCEVFYYEVTSGNIIVK